MLKFAIPIAGLLACTAWALQPPERAGHGTPPPAKPDAPPQGARPEVKPDGVVSKAIDDYTAAYNKHDAAALAEFWAPDAVSQDGDTGERIVGRDAIRKHFESFFKEHPDGRLAIRVDHVRHIKPDIVTLEGVATITSPQADPDENTFSAILVKSGDRWFIDMAKETARPALASSHDALKSLEWMIGTWADDTPGVDVETSARWSENKTFLLRQYSVTYEGQPPIRGTQVIGWDPRSKTIRSWTFGADGSFGEGTWAQSGSEWRVRFSHVRNDGSVLSGLQIITKNDDSSATVQTVGREIDGEPAPSTVPIKTMRKSESRDTKPAAPAVSPSESK